MIIMAMIITSTGSCKKASPYPEPDKLCALTFDDGPSVTLTPLVLDKLEKHGVPATFFMVGKLINDQTKSVIERVVSLKCEIGNHSFDYSAMNSMPVEKIKDSVDKTTELIKKYSGQTPVFFRPPSLAVSKDMYEAIDLTFAEGIVAYDWQQNTDAQTRANSIIYGVRDGAIILLHDVQPLPHPTPEALDIIIPELRKQGYEFVTLSELFKRKGIDPASEESVKKMWKFVNN